jgi:hypothetical protein
MASGEGLDGRFLEGLARIPTLNSVAMWVDQVLGTEYSLSVLLKSNSLKSLLVQRDQIMRRGTNIPPQSIIDARNQVAPLCRALEQCNHMSTLRSLDLEHDMCAEGLFLMAGMLNVNTTLRSLTLSFLVEESDICDEIISRFCSALRENKSLLHFQNRKASQLRVTRTSQQAILVLLQTYNYTIRVLDLCRETEEEEHDKEFSAQKFLLLKLNFWGREHILNRATSNSSFDWINLLHTVRDDLDCIYYFLSKDPSLIVETCCAPSKGNDFGPERPSSTYDAVIKAKVDNESNERLVKRQRIE